MKEGFKLHPELIEAREELKKFLSAAGVEWFTDYQGIDLEHERYGLEVGEYETEQAAERMLRIMDPAFPQWRFRFVREVFLSGRLLGYFAVICREPSDYVKDEFL